MVWMVILNFINLSVNFQESNLSLSNQEVLADPIDTLSELVYEWALEGDCDVIPDNGTEQEDKSVKKSKIWGIALELEDPEFLKNHFIRPLPTSTPFFSNRVLNLETPPPDFG